MSTSKNNIHVDKLPIKSINRYPISINRKLIEIEKNILLDSECDELIFKNGEIENVIVEEVTKNEIKYRMCDNQEGPLFIVDRSELFMIKYKNGTKTVLNEHNEKKEKESDKIDNEVEDEVEGEVEGETEKQEASEQDSETKKSTHPLAIWGLTLSILGFFVPYVGALVCWTGLYFSLKALKSIKENPNKYKGKGLARAGQIIGWIGIILSLIVSIAILVILFV